jgi:SAM-dependent methyltransferase
MELKSRPCPLCGTVDQSDVFLKENYDLDRLTHSAFSSRKLPEYMHFRLMRCSRDDLVYASPTPTLETLAEAYREASFEASKESEYAAKTYVKFLRSKRGLKPTKTLDIGAGDGAFLFELQKWGFDDLVGFEPSEAPVRAANEAIRGCLRREIFDSSSFDEATFGLVTCFQTIEHVFDPLALLRDMYRILEPGGTAFLIGHNVDAFSAKVMGEKSPIFDVEHLQLFNLKSAELLMRQSGFRDIAVFPILNSYPLSYWTKLFPLPDALKTRVLAEFAGRLSLVGNMNVPMPAGNLGIVATR